MQFLGQLIEKSMNVYERIVCGWVSVYVQAQVCVYTASQLVQSL